MTEKIDVNTVEELYMCGDYPKCFENDIFSLDWFIPLLQSNLNEGLEKENILEEEIAINIFESNNIL